MNDKMTFQEAVEFARCHATKGLEQYPFDAIYRTTLDRIAEINAISVQDRGLDELPVDPDIGLMAAKELGNDEAEFAHALHTIQRHIDETQGRGFDSVE